MQIGGARFINRTINDLDVGLARERGSEYNRKNIQYNVDKNAYRTICRRKDR